MNTHLLQNLADLLIWALGAVLYFGLCLSIVGGLMLKRKEFVQEEEENHER